ncbi:MAG: hypothetical protein IJT53_06620 [Prevotella sp.]|nr:hypothetical protein [Prevotella sp.]
MKKLFTLVALLTCFMGAKAQQQWEEVYKIDYTTYTGFPFYVMGYVPEFDNGHMTDFGADYRYATQDVLDNGDNNGNGKLTEQESIVGTTMAGTTEYQKVTGSGPYWHQYFIADGITTIIDETYKVVAMVKASEAVNINVNMGWGWGNGEQMGTSVAIPQSEDFVEVEWEYSGIGGSSCNLVAQPGTATATIEWQGLVVYHKMKANQRPKEWLEAITNGDAETAWPAWALEETDGININWRGDRSGEICAWALTMGKNFQESVINSDSPRARPFPADIEAEAGNESNHIFVVHTTEVKPVDESDANSVAWANQFWIQSPQGWKSGSKTKIKFRYKADVPCSAGTQIHKQHPSDYLYWQAVGDVNFTTEWQTFEKEFTFDDNTANGWSLAFNLNSDATNGRTPNNFYFDDLSWQYLKLDDGYFISGINTETTTSYDNLDNAVEFTESTNPDADLEAVIGEEGNPASYVSQVMISTVRGDDAAFKGATLKPNGKINNDADDWLDYVASSNAKLDLPGLGVWKVFLDTNYGSMSFQMIEGTMFEEPDPVDIVTNATEVVVKGQERDWRGTDNEGNPIEAEVGEGQPWDNQFFLVANRTLKAGEVTVMKFKYKASKEAKTSTQSHNAPGQYVHWGAIGDVNFTEDWQDFETEFTVPNECDGNDSGNGYMKDFRSIAFNMAEIKEACDYELKDFQWYLKYDEEGKTLENLIDETGAKNFYVKEGAGTDPYIFGTESGVSSLIYNNNVVTATYNLAGQRVAKDYKGIVVKNGSKVVVK